MNLVDLIPYLVTPERLKELYVHYGLNEESEALLIYLKGELDLYSTVVIFEIEETEDEIIFEKEGETYIQLFLIEHAIELIKSDLDLDGRGYSELEIATRLLAYRKNDA